MNLFLARTCLAIWQRQLSCCKSAQTLFLLLTQNSDSNIKLEHGAPAPKRVRVCVHVCVLPAWRLPQQPRCMATSVVLNKTKLGNNVPADHLYSFLNYRLPVWETARSLRQCLATACATNQPH